MTVSLATAPWLVHVAFGSLYLAMAVLVVARRPRAILNIACGVLIFCFAFWCACLSVSHYPEVSRSTAIRFYDVGALAWGSFASVTGMFVAAFLRPTLLRSKAFIAALVLPAAAAIYAQWTGRLAADYLPRPWGYAFVWKNSIAANLYTAYYSIYMLVSVWFMLVAARRDKAPVRRKQARIIAGSALLPLAFGSITDVVLPRAGIYAFPNLASDVTIVWVFGLVYATVRYRMLDLRPRVAADVVVETMSDALFLVDPEGRIAWPNRAAVRLFGRSSEELRKLGIAEILGGELAFAEAAGESGRRDVIAKRKDGVAIHVSTSTSEIRGRLNELVGWVYVATDVTTRRRAEAEVRHARDVLENRVAERTHELKTLNHRLLGEISERRRSEARYRLLLEAMHEGLVVLDREDRTTLVNSRFGQILGWEPAELQGRLMAELVDEKSAEMCAERLRQAHAGIAGPGDWGFRHRNGTLLSTIVQIAPLPTDDAGEHQGCVLTVMDVTERDRMQAQLTRAQRLASLGLLAAGVGHEINNPLTYVILNLEQVREIAAKFSSLAQMGDVAELVDDSLEGARRVQDIVKDLRRFSRGESRPLGPIHVHDAIEAAIKLAQNEVRFRARLVREYGAAIPRVVANPGSLSQVFVNLIVNAAHAIAEGNTAENEIRIRTSVAGDEVLIEFADTGKGIPPEDIDRLFDPFFSTKQANDGLGLGLAMCHETIASLGGRIFVGSQLGKGSRFLVALNIFEAVEAPEVGVVDADAVVPAAAVAPAVAPYAGSPSRYANRPPASTSRILVIDDEEGVRKTLRRLLRVYFEVVVVASGEEACRLLAEDPGFDLILCDLTMPGMSGMAFAEWVAVNVPSLSPRMIFMTGGAFTPEAERFLATVPDRCLEKPFNPDEVILLTREALARWSREAVS